ncbi:protein PET100 [Microdochium nivale]|nr:protein PET100 [Microdochium nivale]
MGGTNLEVFKFGMYVMFPIGIMYYFGTNLDERFSVPEFWPKASEGNKVPFEKDEIHAELARLRAKRLYLRDQRLAEEKRYNEIHGIRTAEGRWERVMREVRQMGRPRM